MTPSIECLPLISCICITRAKPWLLKRAIECYLAQTYPIKELFILYEDDDWKTKSFIQQNSFHNHIKVCETPVSEGLKLGGLRNKAIELCSGDFICQWDDDDWYHSNRLLHQYNALLTHDCNASILDQWLVFDETKRAAYLSNKRMWEGSVLCRRSAIRETRYESIHIGEDTAVIDYLRSKNYVVSMSQYAQLYIYVYHGGNTWHQNHWQKIFDHSTRMREEDAVVIDRLLQNSYSVPEASNMLDLMLINYHSTT